MDAKIRGRGGGDGGKTQQVVFVVVVMCEFYKHITTTVSKLYYKFTMRLAFSNIYLLSTRCVQDGCGIIQQNKMVTCKFILLEKGVCLQIDYVHE